MDYEVVIMPSYSQVEAWQKQEARSRGRGLFAQTVTTFDAWIADLWELHGDGRALVDGTRREVMMRALCQQAGGALATPGVAPMAAACMRQAAGLAELEQAIADAGGGRSASELAEGEVAFLRLLAQYEELLESCGLLEPGQAAIQLARDADRVFPRRVSVLADEEVTASWIVERFFGDCPSLFLTTSHAYTGDAPSVPDGLEVKFAFPSGRLAEPGVVVDIVREYAHEGDVVVACKDPLKMYGQTEALLAGLGLRVSVQASKRFGRTDFGRTYLAMYHCLHDDSFNPAMLADALASPFSGVQRFRASEIDEKLRQNRLADYESECAGLRVESERFSQLEELASDPDADVLIGVFEQAVQAATWRSPAWRAEQLAAMGALKGAMAAARGVHAGIEVCAGVLEAASVRVSFMAEGGQGTHVSFVSQDEAARMGDGNCATLVVADLTTEDYPVSEREDALSTLLEKLGLAPAESALDKARRTFSNLLHAPTERIVFARPLNNASSDETYASAALEEFIDNLTEAEAGGTELARPYGVPSRLCEDAYLRGEEDLYANACALPAGSAQASAASLPWPLIHDIDAGEVRKCAPYRPNSQGEFMNKPCPSPSQIEVYLACPFQWFVDRRIKSQELDEGFGAIERGRFAHEVLQEFYLRFQQSGHMKVNGENLSQARALMGEVLEELKQAQYDEAHAREGRLVPRDVLESREIEVLCRQLVDYLDFEARLLPTFHPVHFEYEIEVDEMAEYAGAYLAGKVDRIDVDDKGHAVIIDYKGSVGDGHQIAEKDAAHAGKVQTRIYAQVVKRLLGLDVVGALYVTYGRNPVVSGAYDATVLDSVHLPGVVPKKNACGKGVEEYDLASEDFSFSKLSFVQVLDATEELAGRAIEGMCAGAIAPNPTGGSCEYCSVLCCPKRGA